jgi:hypothetical protein
MVVALLSTYVLWLQLLQLRLLGWLWLMHAQQSVCCVCATVCCGSMLVALTALLHAGLTS